ncbi:trace amine-associated receptor 7c-like [Stylophora pistillata]|uniref:trace amine-associated receptor 7c-like n=1 Tax=Stylophora pistillata TaxID=50429 RepID=UPI000C03AC1D|nr:trace amine-associated receptor 7c-like [Stylophora pistillata]
MAVTDLATGAITMPMSAIVDVLMLTQVSVEHVCTFDSVVNKCLMFLISSSSLYHLTAIAWERYMAIKCSTDYRNKVTKRLLKILGATAWLLAILKQIPTVAMIIIGVDRKIVDQWLALEIILVVTCLFAIAYFYIMVFLGLRKRKQNQTSQVTSMIKAKLESKVAKTTRLLTAGLLISFVPSIVIATLGNFFPVFRMNSTFRLSEVFVQFNSILTPVLYFYSDRRFRNAVQGLLGMKTSRNNQQSIDAAQSSNKNDSSTASKELPGRNGKTISSIQKTFSSTDIAGKVDEGPKAALGRSISDLTLYQCPRDSVVSCGTPPDEPS